MTKRTKEESAELLAYYDRESPKWLAQYDEWKKRYDENKRPEEKRLDKEIEAQSTAFLLLGIAFVILLTIWSMWPIIASN